MTEKSSIDYLIEIVTGDRIFNLQNVIKKAKEKHMQECEYFYNKNQFNSDYENFEDQYKDRFY